MPSDRSEPLRVQLLVDQLECGGCQRQLVYLAVGLKRLGHQVQVLTYWPQAFFVAPLEEAGIPVVNRPASSRLRLVYTVRQAIRRFRPHVVIGFSTGANTLAELAALPQRGFGIIATERGLTPAGPTLRNRAHYALHRIADAVIANSYAQRDELVQAAPHLADRVQVIVNGVDLDHFRPAAQLRQPGPLRLLVLGRFDPQKNPFGLLEATQILAREHPGLDLTIDWYGPVVQTRGPWSRAGRRHNPTAYHDALQGAISRNSLQDRFRLHPEERDVLPLFQAADAFCLPSHYEGTANAVLEAMSCGIPVLASRVADNSRLVLEGKTGFLFNPAASREIAAAIARFAREPLSAKRRMGAAGRQAAEAKFGLRTYLERFLPVIREAAARQGRNRAPTGP